MSDVTLDLIFNRESDDVEKLKELRKKVRNGTATDKEKADWLSASIGAYEYSDMNRIGNAINYIAEVLNKYSYENDIQVKTDWKLGSFPTETGLRWIWYYLHELNRIFPYYSEGEKKIPKTGNNLTFSGANDLEEYIYILHKIIKNMERGFVHSGVCGLGQNRIWQQRFRRYNRSSKQWLELTQIYWNDFSDTETWEDIIYD